MDPFLVVVILSCIVPISVARVGWYPTADGIRPSRADTCKRKQHNSTLTLQEISLVLKNERNNILVQLKVEVPYNREGLLLYICIL